ncbi:xaa-Pro aminopeptidase 3 isoform X2 [Bacillus rossius redtenbacheri]|uniref:xaa-Pro aminopeptidase 3 isoform X2 n=1 Tax=Bacillus rossius redtenbacheri TaxID=93214 RepID=UPI002FDE9A5B
MFSFSIGCTESCAAFSKKAAAPKTTEAEKCKDDPPPLGQPTPSTHPHLLQNGEVLPGLKLEEFQERRNSLLEKIFQYSALDNETCRRQHLIVIPSASKVYMTDKIPYVFRQNTDFLYLSGCLEPDSVLVLSGALGESCSSTLFVRKKDPHSELWDGPRTGVEEAVKFFGVNDAVPFEDLGSFLTSFGSRHRDFKLWYDFATPVNSQVHKTIYGLIGETMNKMWESPKLFVQQLRLRKSSGEVALMESSCRIASDAIAATVRSSFPGATEHLLFARVDYECRARGAEYLAYPPVVAGGDRANIIHYISNNQVVRAGEMVLMDAGCEYHGYSSDITRTWPVSGRFSPAQRDLYEVVLAVQSDVLRECRHRPSLDALFRAMCCSLGRYLREIGLLPRHLSGEELAQAAYKFCPHHVSHYLGMDVHDTPLIPRSIRLEPGMIITIEPGIYVNKNNAFAPPEFHGLGVRIEDDVLITEDGPVVLTAACPKTVDDVEKLSGATPVLNL